MHFNRLCPRPVPIPEPEPERIVVRTVQPIHPVAREVNLIHRLQQEAINRQGHNLPCGNRNQLGSTDRTYYNTRPFILILQNGDEFSIRVNQTQNPAPPSIISSTPNPRPNDERASIFRVEEVNGNSAIIRALKCVLGKYIATCQCATVNLSDFVGIQTLNDTFVTNLLC